MITAVRQGSVDETFSVLRIVHVEATWLKHPTYAMSNLFLGTSAFLLAADSRTHKLELYSCCTQAIEEPFCALNPAVHQDYTILQAVHRPELICM